jgi:DNA uptake protein ComE-like DNA-binding protein
MLFSDDFKRFFQFNYSERRGVFMLCVLLFVFVLCAQLDYNDVFGSNHNIVQLANSDTSTIALLVESDSLVAEANAKNLEANSVKKKYPFKTTFDPNICSEKELLAVGFYPQIAKRIIKYRMNGGVFKTKADIKKMYGVSPHFFESIAPQINIDTVLLAASAAVKGMDTRNTKVYGKFAEIKQVDINKAGFPTWLKISHDSILAVKILKHKKALGGFVQLEQLKEIEGFSDSLFQSNIAQFNVNTDAVFRKLNINLAEAGQLKYHPYIGGKLAKLIIAYRQSRAFTSIEELMKLPLVNEALFQKLKPYVFVTTLD